jgi:hypothetical protein
MSTSVYLFCTVYMLSSLSYYRNAMAGDVFFISANKFNAAFGVAFDSVGNRPRVTMVWNGAAFEKNRELGGIVWG